MAGTKSKSQMKRQILLLILSLAFVVPAGITSSGCSTQISNQTGDPVVVNAEKTIAVAFDTIDTFLRWERTNSAIVPPNVASVATKLRLEAPDAFRNARSVLRAYKGNRTPEQRQLVESWLAVLSQLANIAANNKQI